MVKNGMFDELKEVKQQISKALQCKIFLKK